MIYQRKLNDTQNKTADHSLLNLIDHMNVEEIDN